MSSRRCGQTIREQMDGPGSTAPVYVAAFAVCVGAVCTGIALAWTSNVSEKLIAGSLNGMFFEKMDVAWAVGIMKMGCCVTTIPIGILLDTIGRKTTMMVATLPFYVGYVLIAFATHKYMLFAGRFIIGLGAGAFSCCSPLYAAEIAHKEIRGSVVSFYFMFVSFGFVYANVLGWLLPIKLFIFACIIVPVIFTTMFFFQPKSPVYSIQSGKAMEAMEALKALRGSKYDVTAEMKTIKLELSIALGGSNFFQLFKDRGVIRGFIISVTLLILKHLVGSTLVLIFTSEIVKACGFGDIAVKSAVITGGMIQALASFVPLYLVDRVGRRFLLIIGFSITLISSAVLGAFYVSLDRKLLSPNLLNTFSFVPLSALALYWFGYGVGLGNIAALTAVEIFPACFRAKLKCFSEFVNWSASFVVTMTYLQFGEAYGHDLLYFFYCFFSIIGILLVIYVYPEASRKTSLEIFDEIRKRKHIFRRYRAEPIRGLR